MRGRAEASIAETLPLILVVRRRNDVPGDLGITLHGTNQGRAILDVSGGNYGNNLGDGLTLFSDADTSAV